MTMPGVLVFERRDERGRTGRVYVRGDDEGRAQISGFDLDEGVTLSRTEVEKAIRAHLDSLLESGQGFLAETAGIKPGAPVRTNRGPRTAPDEQLDELVETVLHLQVAAEKVQVPGYSDRRLRELMAKAESEGRGVKVERQPGRANRYVRQDRHPVDISPLAPTVDRDRARRVLMNAKRDELEHNYQRQLARPRRARQSRQLSDFDDSLAREGDAQCEARVGDPRHIGAGRRCILKAGHEGRHAALFDEARRSGTRA